MVDILHRIGVEGVGPDTVDDALTTRDGLAARWKRVGTEIVGELRREDSFTIVLFRPQG